MSMLGRQVMSGFLLLAMLLGTGIAHGEPVLLAERTPVKLRIMSQLTSGKSKVGEAVNLMVCEAIKDSQGRVLVADGAKAVGKVTVSKKRGMFGRQGKLEFTVESVQAVDGGQVPLRAQIENSGKSNRGVVIASALLLSVLSVFVHGRDVTVKEGTEFVAYVDKDTLVDPLKSPSASPVVQTSPAPTPNLPSSPVPQPAQPSARFVVLTSLLAGTNVVGELKNEGPEPAAAEVIVLIKKDDKAVGAGTVMLDKLDVGEKRSFSVAIQGSTDGTVSIEVWPKTLSTAPAAPNAGP